VGKKTNVFRENDVEYLKDYLLEAVRAVINEQAMDLGKGTDLEQALVDAINGTEPKYFQDFVKAAAKDLGVPSATKLDHGKLTSEWKKWGGADSTSKADVQFGNDGVSMKMGASAMLFGFGPGDAQACMMAAMMTAGATGDDRAKALLAKLGEMQQAIGRAPLGVLKRAEEMRNDLKATGVQDADVALGAAAASIGDDSEGYVMDPAARAGLTKQIAKAKRGDEKAAARIKKAIEKGQLALPDGSTGPEAAAEYKLGDELQATDSATKKSGKDADYKIKFDPKMEQKEAMATIATVDELMDHAEKILGLETALKEIESEVVELLNPEGNDALRLAFFKEALTGEQKFGAGTENVATHVYITQDSQTLARHITGNPDTDAKTVKGLHLYKPLDAAYIQTIANAATWRGKFRSDSIKVKKKKTGYNLFRSSLIAEIKSSSKGGKAYLDTFKGMLGEIVQEAIDEGLITEQELLEEGWFGDMADNVVGGVKKVATAAVRKGAEYWGSFVEKLTKSIDSLLKWFKDSIIKIAEMANKLFESIKGALQKGVAGIVDFFGITAEEIAQAVEPPSDEKTTIFMSQLG